MTRTVDQQGFKKERLILFLDFLSLAPTHAVALPHGLFLAGLIHVFMSREAVLKHLHQDSLKSVSLNAAVGVPVPHICRRSPIS